MNIKELYESNENYLRATAERVLSAYSTGYDSIELLDAVDSLCNSVLMNLVEDGLPAGQFGPECFLYYATNLMLVLFQVELLDSGLI
ncbi:MAG: hypothetical protein COA73_12150 [Candidatus Hydrogenedentota bacterium]|nr:MAG: hypothetical protein COA73_12150 [Candidatus Hydrogenedentota bacterium]